VVDTNTAPLAGVRVLDFTHYIAGPYAAMILGDLGADVLKVEPPGGEPGRHSAPLSPGGVSLYFASYNRNKRNLNLDLRSPDNDAELVKLLADSDVVVTNFALGVPERLGFGFERIRALNPRCSMIQITGCGSWSAYRSYMAFDGVAQAMSGFADMTGDVGGPPTISNIFLGDHVSAMQAALAAVAALHRRTLTGVGSYVEVSMLRALSGLLGYNVALADVLGHDPRRSGNRSAVRFMNVFPTSDGNILLNPITSSMWRELCAVLEHPGWGTDEIAERAIEEPDLRAEIEESVTSWLATRTTLDAEASLQARGIACAGVRTVRQLIEEDEPKELRLFERIELPTGEMALVMGRLFDWANHAHTDL